MTTEVFEQALARAVQFRDAAADRFQESKVTVTLCGLGEPLLNGHTPSFVRRICDEGFACALSSNASCLDDRTGEALLDAGLRRIFINAGDLGRAYEEVYGLAFERTRDNIAGFVARARDRCQVVLVVVGHDENPERARAVEAYWADLGVEIFAHHDLINRGGSLSIDGAQLILHPHLGAARTLAREGGITPVCGVPFRFLFVGYDGNYYLCSSDWEKRVPLGSVFDQSFSAAMKEKLERVASREPICRSCTHDPLNRMAESLRALAEDGADGPAARVALLRSATAEEHTVRVVAESFLHAPTP
jgi:MoaA/NifB/PqqE/SkfB family radical SAM enzyme